MPIISYGASPERSLGQGGSRYDPKDQIETIHLSPAYRNSTAGRHVVVVDDCTTYGISFGAAAAFLRRAGASSVTGVALGKFGNVLQYHDIETHSDPFSPVGTGQYPVLAQSQFPGDTNGQAQQNLLTLVP